MIIRVYEYYDGYEHLWEQEDEAERTRVQYFVLGDVSSSSVGICYINLLNKDYSFVATIGKQTHEKAWINGYISLDIAKECIYRVLKRQNPSLQKYRDKYNIILQDSKKFSNKNRIYTENVSHSCSDGLWDVSFSWDSHENYYSAFAFAIETKIKLLELPEEFLL